MLQLRFTNSIFRCTSLNIYMFIMFTSIYSHVMMIHGCASQKFFWLKFFVFISLLFYLAYMLCDWFQPPKIKAFIEKVIQCPLQDIAIPLFGFRWEYNKVIEWRVAADSILLFLLIDLCICFIRGIFITGDHCCFILIHISRHIYHVEMTWHCLII